MSCSFSMGLIFSRIERELLEAEAERRQREVVAARDTRVITSPPRNAGQSKRSKMYGHLQQLRRAEGG